MGSSQLETGGLVDVTRPPAAIGEAIRAQPARFLGSSWPWRALGYVASGAVVSLVPLGVFRLATGSGSSVVSGVAFVVLMAVAYAAAAPIGVVERRRLYWVAPGWESDPRGGRRSLWARPRLRTTATRREALYAVAFLTVIPLVDLVAVMVVALVVFLPFSPLLGFVFDFDSVVTIGVPVTDPWGRAAAALVGVALVPVAAYMVAGLAAVQVAIVRSLLVPRGSALATQVLELTRSRTRLVDAFEAERRRIERDLHDGVQQRLVTLIMQLGMVELELERGTGRGPHLVQASKELAEQTLGELRELTGGIHPQILTDRGLAAAVVELADRLPIPVSVDIDLPYRPGAAVEAVAYFVVSESFTNVIKHGQASRVTVVARMAPGRLLLSIADDGVGGADPDRGTGLQGLGDRVAAVGGTLSMSSPQGGPTELQVDLPCP